MWSASSSPSRPSQSTSSSFINIEKLKSPQAMRLAMESVRLDSEIAHLKQRAAQIEHSVTASTSFSSSYSRSRRSQSPSRQFNNYRSESPVRSHSPVRSKSPTRSPSKTPSRLDASLSDIRYRNAKFLARLSSAGVRNSTRSSDVSLASVHADYGFEATVAEFESVIESRDSLIAEYTRLQNEDETELIHLRAQLKAQEALHKASLRGAEAKAQIHIVKAQEGLKTATAELIAEYDQMHEETHEEVAQKHATVEALREDVSAESSRLENLMDSLIQKENEMANAISLLENSKHVLENTLEHKDEFITQLQLLVKKRENEIGDKNDCIAGLENELKQWRLKYGHNFIVHGEGTKSPNRPLKLR